MGAYNYTIRYKQGKTNANADALSRLPLAREVPQPAEVVHLMECLDTTPLSSTQIKTWTDADLTLSKVRRWVQEGWPEQDGNAEVSEDVLPYPRRRLELGVEGGCVLWGCRVVVPKRGRQRALEMLHESHPGIARMKSLGRTYMWWPGMDREIEEYVKGCTVCQMSRKDPPVAPFHSWAWPERPWTRVHIDYAGPMEGRMFLVIMDAHTKWMEVHSTSSSTSTATIELLRKTFASLGLPEVVVSDNAAAFTSTEFTDFLRRNGIRHVRTPPYHPASNGLAERAVQTFKEGIKRLKGESLNNRFLFKYRLTPHTSTGVSPAELMFGRKLRSQLDLLRPSTARTAHQAQNRQKAGHDLRSQPRSFTARQTVYAKNYGAGPKWLPGVLVKAEGSVLWHVRLSDGRIIRRHVDQLRPRAGNDGPLEAEEELGATTGGSSTTQNPEMDSAEIQEPTQTQEATETQENWEPASAPGERRQETVQEQSQQEESQASTLRRSARET